MVTDVRSSLSTDSNETRSIPTLGFTGYVVPGKGEYVLWVQPGSMADQLGLASGDMLLSVNDRPLTAVDAWRRAMAPVAAGGSRVTLRVRHGQTGVVSSQTLHLFPAVGRQS